MKNNCKITVKYHINIIILEVYLSNTNLLLQAQELNKQFAQKIRDRDNIIIRVREANRQLKAESNNQNGYSNKPKLGAKKRFDHELNGKSVEEMESDIDDLKSQLEGRDDEVKASKKNFLYNFLLN